MNFFRSVKRAERARELRQHRAELDLVVAGWCADVANNVDTQDELHRKEPGSAELEELAEHDQVFVVNVLKTPELVLDPEDRFRLGTPERLQCNPGVGVAVERRIN